MSIYILMALPFSALIRDILIIDLGLIFLTTFKMALLVGGLYFYKHINLHIISNKITTPILKWFLIYNFILLISTIYSDAITFSQKINYMFLFTSSIVITYGLSKKIIMHDYKYYYDKLTKILILIFFLSLIMSFLQIFVDRHMLSGIGVYPESIPYISGFNIERLFLCEFLILGIFIILLEKKYNFFLRVTLLLLTISIIYLTGSFTGLLGLLSLLAIPKHILKLKYFISLMVLVVVSIFYIIPAVNSQVLTESELYLREQRTSNYFEDSKEANWRVVSSLVIINNFVTNPTLFGHGFKSNDKFLSDLYGEYTFKKGASGESKPVSSHTFVSILYDQGIVGFMIYLILFFHLTNLIIKIHKKSKYIINKNMYYISRLSIVFAVLFQLRLLFYYQAVNHWNYLIAIILLNYTVFTILQNKKFHGNYK